MNLYSAVIRLGGSKDNEVLREDLTAADVLMLKFIHGGDESVRNVTHVGFLEIDPATYRARTVTRYGTGEFDSSTSGANLMKEVFGPPSVPLPRKLEGVQHYKPGLFPLKEVKEFTPVVAAAEEDDEAEAEVEEVAQTTVMPPAPKVYRKNALVD